MNWNLSSHDIQQSTIQRKNKQTMSTIEITNDTQFEHFVIQYGQRFHNCQRFTVNDLMQHLPSANKTVLSYKLQDLALKGTIKQINKEFFYVPDERELTQKIIDCFGNRYTFLSIAQLTTTLKQREDHIKESVQELVKSGKLVQCPFIGGSFWLNESQSEASN